MKAYVKKNLVASGNGRFIVPGMRTLEGTIIDVVWSAGDKGELPGWRTESYPWYYWDDDWLVILPDGYNLAKAIEINIKWYNTWKELNNNLDECLILNSAFNNTIAIRDKEIASYKTRIDGLMDSIAQKDAILKDRIDYLYTK